MKGEASSVVSLTMYNMTDFSKWIDVDEGVNTYMYQFLICIDLVWMKVSSHNVAH